MCLKVEANAFFPAAVLDISVNSIPVNFSGGCAVVFLIMLQYF